MDLNIYVIYTHIYIYQFMYTKIRLTDVSLTNYYSINTIVSFLVKQIAYKPNTFFNGLG